MIKRNNIAKIIISIILALFFWTFTCMNMQTFIVYLEEPVFMLSYFITALVSCLVICLLGCVRLKLPKPAEYAVGAVVYALALSGAMSISILISGAFETSLVWVYFINILFYFAFGLLALIISGSMRVSAITTVAVSYAFNMSSCIIYSLRGSSLMPTDLLAWGTAMTVASEYEFKLKYEMITATVLACALIMLAFKFPIKFRFKFRRVIVRSAGAAALAAVVLVITLTNYDELDVSEYDQYSANMNFGSALSFYVNAKKMGITQSASYDPEKLDRLLLSYDLPEEAYVTEATEIPQESEEDEYDEDEEYDETDEEPTPSPSPAPTKKPQIPRIGDYSDEKTVKSTLAEDGEKPNIIVIMNESFADLKAVGDFKTNEDYMPFFHSLENNTIKGELLVSPFGGYTCNTEYEFLTGMSTGLLGAHSAPYLQMMFRKLPYSLNTHMRRLGYKATAIHPFTADSWNRKTVYNYLGFDEFISQENFDKYSEFPEYLRNYISDKGNYSAIINMLYAKDPDEREFVFNITMQNHGGYTDKKFDNEIYLEGMEGSYPEAEQYLSLIKHSDDALKYLINTLKDFEEPTIVVMFGDHMPNIETEFYEELYGRALTDLNTEDSQRRYQVPFILWANYDIEEKTGVKTSPCFLSNLIMETAQLPKSRVQLYLDDLQDEVKQINPAGYYDADGDFHSHSETERFGDYYDLQYALLKGERLHYDFNIENDNPAMFGDFVISPRYIFGKEYDKIKSANP